MSSSLSHLEAQRTYAGTKKGLATRRRYRQTEKAKLTRRMYLVGKNKDEVGVSVYYWRDAKYLNGMIPGSRDVFGRDYVKLPLKLDELWEGDATEERRGAKEHRRTMERVFTYLNRERSSLCKKTMQEWIMENLKPHPHTSMSLGDVVEIRREVGTASIGGKKHKVERTELWLCGLYDWVDLVERWNRGCERGEQRVE